MAPTAVSAALVALALVCSLHGALSDVYDRQRLEVDLLASYSADIHPDNIVLTGALSLLCATYDSDGGILTTKAVEIINWSDNRLTWNPAAYGGESLLHLPPHRVWRPDINLMNSIVTEEDRSAENVIITSTGQIAWAPEVSYQTPGGRIPLSGKLDSQLELTTWNYDETDLTFSLLGSGIFLSEYFNDTCPYVVDKVSTSLSKFQDSARNAPYDDWLIDIVYKPNPNIV